MATDLTVDADLEFSVDIPGSRTVTGVADRLRQVAGASRQRPVRLRRAGRLRPRSADWPRPWPTRGSRSAWSRVRPTGHVGRDADVLAAAPGDGLAAHPHRARAGLWTLVRGRSPLPARRALSRRPSSLRRPRLYPDRADHGSATDAAGSPRRTIQTGAGIRGSSSPLGAVPEGRRPAPVFPLRDDVTTIGSGADCDIRLAGSRAAARRGPARRRGRVRARTRSADAAGTRVHGAPVSTRDPANRDRGRSRRVAPVVLPRGVRRPRPPVRRSDRRGARPSTNPAQPRVSCQRRQTRDRDDLPGPVLVAGASGFVGRRLCPALTAAGHRGPGHDPPSRHLQRATATPCTGTCTMPPRLPAPSRVVELPTTWCTRWTRRTSNGWTRRPPRRSARPQPRRGSSRSSTWAGSAARPTQLSSHLRSRREVEGLLGGAGTPVTVLQRRHHRRQRRHLVGDDASAGRAPAGDGHAALGAHQDAADRRCRRRPLPGRRARTSRGRRAGSSRSAAPR